MFSKTMNRQILTVAFLVSFFSIASLEAQRFDQGGGPVGGPGDVIVDETLPTFPTTCGFGEDLRGTLTTDFAGDDDRLKAVAMLRNGKLVVVGEHDGDFALTVYNPDGSLDPSFGVGGKVTTDIDGNDDSPRDALVQPDGKIIVVGRAMMDRSLALDDDDMAVARYFPNGNLDGSFGENGRVAIDFGQGDGAYAVALQKDGKIIVVGTQNNLDFRLHHTPSHFAIIRLLPDGRLDPSFDGDGKRSFGDDDDGRTVEVLPDGRVLASGSRVLFRFHPDGSLDQSFDGDGKMTHRTDGDLLDLVVREDGSFFALTTNSLDSYDAAGNLMYSRNLGFEGAALARQDDGLVVVAGTAKNLGRGDFALARYFPDGAIDMSFGGDGYVTTGVVPGTAPETLADLLIQPDDKILAAGYVDVDGNEDYTLGRFLPGGELDRCEPDPVANDPGLFIDPAEFLPFEEILDVTESRLEVIFLRGDANGDGMVNIADPSFISNFVFGIGLATTPPCAAAADTNDDDSLNIADISYLANFIFGIAPATPPPAPFPACGLTRAEVLGCETSVCTEI